MPVSESHSAEETVVASTLKLASMVRNKLPVSYQDIIKSEDQNSLFVDGVCRDDLVSGTRLQRKSILREKKGRN